VENDKPVVLVLMHHDAWRMKEYQELFEHRFETIFAFGKKGLMNKVGESDVIVLGCSHFGDWDLADFVSDISHFYTGPIISVTNEENLPFVRSIHCKTVLDSLHLPIAIRDGLVLNE